MTSSINIQQEDKGDVKSEPLNPASGNATASLHLLPSRLHHTAYVVSDLERTRWFYEDLIGLPLVAAHCEQAEFSGSLRSYCHCFFSLADGGALAFFQFADKRDADSFMQPEPTSPFYHVAFNCTEEAQDGIRRRLDAAAYHRRSFTVDHGYCKSFYVTDPDGMNIEFAVDSDQVDHKAPPFMNAHGELARWLAGDHTPSNALRKHK